MKLIQLELTNINSLRGNHTIDFTNPPLSHSGLFLISGPTGSGKSSILDAITLALFNRIPRFGQPFSKERMKKEGSVVTHFEDHAMAAVTYESEGQIYKSTWSIKKNRNDNWNNYEMSIHRLPQMELIDLQHRREIPAENEKIIGLNYEQFLKSIVLAQGDFAEFLKADHHTRGRLLEKITGTEIYRLIGKMAYEKSKGIVQEVDNLKQEIEMIPILDEETLDQIKDELQSAQESSKALDREIRHLERSKTQLERLKENDDQIKKLSITLEHYKENIANFTSKKTKLDLHNKLIPLKGDILLIEQKVEDFQQVKENAEKINASLDSSKKDLSDCLSKGILLTKEDNLDAKNFLDRIKKLELKYNALSQDLKSHKERGESIRSQIVQIQDGRIDQRLQEKVAPSAALQIIKSIIDSFHEKKTSAGVSEEHIQQELKALNESVSQINNIIELVQQKDKKSKDLSEFKNQSDKLQEVIKQKESGYNQLLKRTEDLEKEVEQKEIERLENQKELKLDDFRADLKSGEPCPLCGSLEHPYSQHEVIFEEGKLSFEIKALKTELKEKQEDLMNLSKDLSGDQSTLKSTMDIIKNLSDEINDLSTKLKNHKSELILDDQKALQLKLKTAKERKEKLQELAIEATLIPVYQNLESKYAELEDVFHSYQNISLQLKKLYAGNDFSSEVKNLQEQFSEASQNIVLFSKQISTLGEEKVKLKKAIEEKNRTLLPKLQVLKIESIESAKNHLLDLAIAEQWTKDYEQDVLKKNDIESKIKQLRDNQLKLKEEIERDETLSEISDQLQTKNQTRETNQVNIGKLNQRLEDHSKNQKLKEDKTRQLSQLQGSNKKWYELNALIGDASGNRFANFAQDLTLQSLIAITNKNLKLLTDRYQMAPSQIEDTLSVYDMYHGDTVRAINTLSGGETFIVSLAMAVSLSELASKNVQIKSIFIDEGFGSLDEDSLEQAMNTLESWQSSTNKTIGIISHVASLKERISTQIQLKRDHKGHSQLRLVG